MQTKKQKPPYPFEEKGFVNGSAAFGQFSVKDFKRFDEIEQTTLHFPTIIESIEFLSSLRYSIKQFLEGRAMRQLINERGKRNITGYMYTFDDGDIPRKCSIRDLLDEKVIQSMNCEETLFVKQIENLMTMLKSSLRLQKKIQADNNSYNFSNEKADRPSVVKTTLKNKYLWLLEAEKIELLFTSLVDLGMLDEMDFSKFQSHFYDKNGNSYCVQEPEMLEWKGSMSELSYTIGKLTQGPGKALGEKDIWAKTSLIFRNKEGRTMTANTLQTSAQRANPKSAKLLDRAIKAIKGNPAVCFN